MQAAYECPALGQRRTRRCKRHTSALRCRPITTFLPLAIVLGVSIFKEAMEDMRRYQADREVNARACLVLDPAAGAWQKRRWRDVQARVGPELCA